MLGGALARAVNKLTQPRARWLHPFCEKLHGTTPSTCHIHQQEVTRPLSKHLASWHPKHTVFTKTKNMGNDLGFHSLQASTAPEFGLRSPYPIAAERLQLASNSKDNKSKLEPDSLRRTTVAMTYMMTQPNVGACQPLPLKCFFTESGIVASKDENLQPKTGSSTKSVQTASPCQCAEQGLTAKPNQAHHSKHVNNQTKTNTSIKLETDQNL